MKIAVETPTYRYPESLTFSNFLGGDFKQFPKDLYEFVEKWARILRTNAAMVLVKILPH